MVYSRYTLSIFFTSALCCCAFGQISLSSRLNAAHEMHVEKMQQSFHTLKDPYRVPPKAKIIVEDSIDTSIRYQYSWKRNIPVRIYWVGGMNNKEKNLGYTRNPWDPNRLASYGGYDDPNNRNGFFPAKFNPKMNPFYVALPYNDLESDGVNFKPEASQVIKWFRRYKTSYGRSVCKSRWLAIHYGYKVCYAQWEDCGPYYTDDYKYVFQNERPRKNRNGPAGLSVSPAVRDFLGISNNQSVSWRFVEDSDVPNGPWKEWRLEKVSGKQ